MKLSVTTNLFQMREDKSHISVIESMRRCKATGFDLLDISFSRSGGDKNHPLNSHNWEKWIDEVAEEAGKLGVEFIQAHIPFYRIPDSRLYNTEEREFCERAKYRSIHACGVLGVKWAVEHLFHSIEDQCDAPKNKKDNLRYFEPFVESAKKINVGIAFENLFPRPERSCYIRYPSTHWELIDFVDTWNDPSVGICWDFGHANLLYKDQSEPLLAMGKRLKAVHVHDNYGKDDNHLAPFLGRINWRDVMKALKEIEYSGTFDMELGNLTKGCPDEVQDMLAKYAFDIGNYLLAL